MMKESKMSQNLEAQFHELAARVVALEEEVTNLKKRGRVQRKKIRKAAKQMDSASRPAESQ